MTKAKGLSKIIKGIILLVGIGLLFHVIYLAYTIDNKTFSLVRSLSLFHILVILLLGVIPWIGHSYRVHFWSKFIGYPIPFKETVPIIIVNDLGAALTPTALGGGPITLTMLIKKGMPPAKATFIILLSALEDVVFYSVGIVFTLLYMKGFFIHFLSKIYDNKIVLYSILATIISLAIFRRFVKRVIKRGIDLLPQKWSTLIHRAQGKITHYLNDIKSAFKLVAKDGKLLLLLSIFILFVQWLAKFSILAVIFHAFGVTFTWFDMYIKQWFVTMASLVIPTPGASGGAEAVFKFIFQGQISDQLSSLIVSVWRFFTFYFVVIISTIVLNVMNRKLLSGEE